MDTLSPFGDRQRTLFDDAPAPVATTPEPADIELTEEVKDEIRRAFRRGAMQTALLARYGINRTTLTNILADCFDRNGGPTDEQLDAIFGPMRAPGVTLDASHGIGTSQKSTETADA